MALHELLPFAFLHTGEAERCVHVKDEWYTRWLAFRTETIAEVHLVSHRDDTEVLASMSMWGTRGSLNTHEMSGR